MEFERGEVTTPLKKLGATDQTGTRITFKADGSIFPDTRFNFDTLQKRFQELAFLNKGVRIKFSDERTAQSEEYHYEQGLIEFVQWLNRTETPIHSEIIVIQGEGKVKVRDDDHVFAVDIVIQYNDGFNENVGRTPTTSTTSKGARTSRGSARG